MSYYDEIVAKVDNAIAENKIQGMNELLVALVHDEDLTQEQRYEQQQRLRTTIFHHGEKHH